MFITSFEEHRKASTMVKPIFWIMGAVLFMIGIPGWYDRLMNGHLHMNYTTLVPWGIGVGFYIYFIGLSAGAFLISSLVYVFNMKRFERIGPLAVLMALVTLLLALLSIWPDIGHMFRFWHIFAYPNFKSPMTVITWLYALYFFLLVTELWFLLRKDLIRRADNPGLRGLISRLLTLGSQDISETSLRRDHMVVRTFATIGIPLAVLFHAGVGALLGVVAARSLWHSPMYPIHFVLAALTSGGALLTGLCAVFQGGLQKNRAAILSLGRIILGLLCLDVLFQISEMLILYYGNIPGHVRSLNLIVKGPYWWVFWFWQVTLGTVIPLVLLIMRTRHHPGWVALSGALIAAGYIGLRLNLVLPGLAIEEIPGLSQAIASARMTTHYVPSITEWLLIVWVIGLGLLLLSLGDWLLASRSEEQNHVSV